ncbi:amidohydrolase [Reichenbachiella sp. 5M10]|uniref:amidohydrolase family protein n=1 Tax=Reichenbachiella sp. 5M10 TaxID=1889772 RepID=UPI000C15623C|nr:amidohydrolase family protein [Reichenbachiella sp. 5M10]PIB34224.1 amidohydrolase [Reichenbachiella sp. 5M10]
MKQIYFVIAFLIYQQSLAQSPDSLLLKDYQPVSIYSIPKTQIEQPMWPVIDIHSHPYAKSEKEINQWVNTMDQMGIDKTIVLTMTTGSAFDSLVQAYSKYPKRFELWCGIDFTGYNEKDWSQKAIAELERCHAIGAKGIGELGDKGQGLLYSKPTPAPGLHVHDPRLQPVLKRCGELGMPVNIHVAEPKWMYEPMNKHNDGLMNGFKWRIDTTQTSLDHQGLIKSLEQAVANNPQTTFIACHFANCGFDLSILSSLLDSYPNLYADISARFGETASIPRYMLQFYQKHQDRLLFGTDMGMDPEMYQLIFRILESKDEHFYSPYYANYHWPLHGFGLPKNVLKKLYYENAQKLLSL